MPAPPVCRASQPAPGFVFWRRAHRESKQRDADGARISQLRLRPRSRSRPVAARSGARPETLEEALVSAYNNNPQLLAERANLRAVDEGVPQALVRLAADGAVHRLGRVASGSRTRRRRPPSRSAHAHLPAQDGRPQCHPADLSGRPHGRQDRRRRAAGRGRARAQRGRRKHDLLQRDPVLFRRAARPVRGRAQHQQRAGPAPPARGDQRPVPRRLGHPHRRGAGRGAARRRARQPADRPRARSRSTAPTSSAPSATRRRAWRSPSFIRRSRRRATRRWRWPRPRIPTCIAAVFTEDVGALDRASRRGRSFCPASISSPTSTAARKPRPTAARPLPARSSFRVTMPLYEGGQIYSQTRQAQEKVAQSLGLTDDARRQAVQAATQAWETIQSARASAYSLQSTIRADRDRARRRAPGAAGRLAHHPRRPQRRAGAVHRPGHPGPGAARSRRRRVQPGAADRHAHRDQSRPAGPALRCRPRITSRCATSGWASAARIDAARGCRRARGRWFFCIASPSLPGPSEPGPRAMSDAKGQHEPSMEEILASIRRIIAEDNEAPEAGAAAADGKPAGAPKPRRRRNSQHRRHVPHRRRTTTFSN